jgi:hypothetical protein
LPPFPRLIADLTWSGEEKDFPPDELTLLEDDVTRAVVDDDGRCGLPLAALAAGIGVSDEREDNAI